MKQVVVGVGALGVLFVRFLYKYFNPTLSEKFNSSIKYLETSEDSNEIKKEIAEKILSQLDNSLLGDEKKSMELRLKHLIAYENAEKINTKLEIGIDLSDFIMTYSKEIDIFYPDNIFLDEKNMEVLKNRDIIVKRKLQ